MLNWEWKKSEMKISARKSVVKISEEKNRGKKQKTRYKGKWKENSRQGTNEEWWRMSIEVAGNQPTEGDQRYGA